MLTGAEDAARFAAIAIGERGLGSAVELFGAGES
jgi:hypothetical protein